MSSDETPIESIIRCPVCGYSKKEIVPADACPYFYICTNCLDLKWFNA